MTPAHDPAQEPTGTWPAAAASPTAPTLPAELAGHPRYRLVEVVGEGGMGRVYKAEHRLMNRSVAIKVIREALLDRPAIRERFVREVRTAAQLTHPNIVAAHDAEQAGDTCFLVMEYVTGDSLAQVVRRRGVLPVAEACEYVRQAALGLQYAHERGLVHRDIKPGNLMLTPDGVVKVLDFGLARFTLEGARESAAIDANPGSPLPPPSDSAAVETASEAGLGTPSLIARGSVQAGEQTVTGTVVGTRAYMAPEQARNARTADIRADIFSLGCTLSYLLFEKPRYGEPDLLSRPDLPSGLVSVLLRMLAPDPANRYQTPAEVAEALLPYCNRGSETGGLRDATARRRRLFALVAGMIVVCSLIALVASGVLSGSDDAEPRDDLRGRQENKATTDKKTDEPPPGIKLIVGRGLTSVAIQVSPNPVVFGQPVELMVTVVPMAPSVGTPTGDVTFFDGNDELGKVPLNGMRASLKTSALTRGEHSLRAVYNGDVNYAVSYSTAVTPKPPAGKDKE